MSTKTMKRGLALGALMAFVITGSAWAEVTQVATYDDKGNLKRYYCTLQGRTDEVEAAKTKSDRIVGGYYIDVNGTNADKVTPDLNSNLTVKNGEWNMMVGGNYIDDYASVLEVNVNSTTLTINGGTAESVVGGSVASGVKNTSFVGAESTNLTINDGTFGGAADTNCPELFVAGGDLLKYNAIGTYDANSNANYIKSKITNTNMTINDGTFDTAIVGGSVAVQNYSHNCIKEIKAEVGTATTNINGGTFKNHPIFAGGMAHGNQTISSVSNAILNIKNIETNVEVYSGGVTGNGSTSMGNGFTAQPTATVGSAVVNIEDSTVGSIYGNNATFKCESNPYKWVYSKNSDVVVDTTINFINSTAETVDVQKGSVTLAAAGDGTTNITTLSLGEGVGLAIAVDGTINDEISGDTSKIAKYITIKNAEGNDDVAKKLAAQVSTVTLEAGDATDTVILTNNKGVFTKQVIANAANTGISDINSVALMSWRAETNDMNKRLGELRNANGEHGVWVRMVRGESEYGSVNHQYNQYQLGYDEKLSVDPSWTVGAAYTYTDAESSFSKGSGENTHKGVAIYGSKLNDDGSFIDLIAKYSRLEHDFDLGTAKGDYSTNGYSVSAEYGKRLQQGNGLWIEPQVELTYGKISSAEYMVGRRNIIQDGIESLVGRVGFSLGKDIKQGNVYARASYLYDFEGETEARFAAGGSNQTFKQDLGGGWWEVGVGTNINLSKATYIYADVEKTFGGEVDTDWQWNLGVRYSF